MADAILNKIGAGKFRAFSAGRQPKGRVHPDALQLLQSLGYDTLSFRSKSWSEFADPGAPLLDFVFTVCDNAAGEVCPVWPGQHMTAHWGVPDPAEAKGTPAEVAFDVPYQDYSWMAYLARAGFDVFAMDTTGYGRSTRPTPMNDPCNLAAAQQALFIPALIPAPCPASLRSPHDHNRFRLERY